MRHLVFAITTLFIGLILGAVATLTVLLMNWLLTLPPFEAVAEWTLFGLPLPVLIGFLALALLVVFVLAWLYMLVGGRSSPDLTNETQRLINKASDGMERLQLIRVSDDGQYGFLALHVEDADWNSDHPFYTPHAVSTTPGAWQTGRYYFLVIHQDRGKLTPIAAPAGYGDTEIVVLMRTTGLDRANNAFWRGLHGVLAETDVPIPLFKLASTSICKLVIGLSSSKLHEQFARYTQEVLFPRLAHKRTDFPAPPRGLCFHAVRCSFNVSGKRLHFREDLHSVPLEKVAETIQTLDNDFNPFAQVNKALLLFPLDAGES
ncbi:hypothetical protein VD792_26600 [Pseudomonas aeruginosa]|uniref:hypothetical protein n=1 Tax=Pseudomonas aeruginosa TaxID=287 RepID=UPI002B4A9EDA|nr:hypothetical protein [Pseudomonas aeruginosa]MEB3081575.1 hypothetical protein [Pseudomonas aeruginosa]MEB3143031.1 hypothetical protein [Pseudomonas aeruginosa]